MCYNIQSEATWHRLLIISKVEKGEARGELIKKSGHLTLPPPHPHPLAMRFGTITDYWIISP